MIARTRDPEATREAILDAAEEVILAKGFGSAATSEIAHRAGVTKSLIHHHFGSKEGLWQEVKIRRLTHYAARQMEMLEGTEPTAELLRESISVYFHFLQANPQVVRILSWMSLEQDFQHGCADIDKVLMDAGVSKLRGAQEAGEIRADIDPRFITIAFLGLAQDWFQQRDHFVADHLGEDTPEDLDDAYLEAFTKIFFEGILPR